MTIKKILIMGEPSLWQPSKPITNFTTKDLESLIKDMADTMEHKRGVGIAAPQIGINKRVIRFGCKENPRYPYAKPISMTLLINPEYEPIGNEKVLGWEGCLSIPGLRGVVQRYQKIHYWGYDVAGNKIERKVESFHARVFQHEYDHIDGVLYPLRMPDLHKFGFEEIVMDKVLKCDIS